MADIWPRIRGAAPFTKKAAILSVFALLLGCGKPTPTSDAPYLNLLGLDTPITASVSLQQPVNAQGFLPLTDDEALVALFVHLGIVKVVPNNTGAPWWTFSAVNGSVDNGLVTVAAAKRVVSSKVIDKPWSDGDADYYGETVNYAVQPTDPFVVLRDQLASTGSIRLLLRKAGSKDTWHIWFGTDRATRSTTGQEGPTLLRALITAGVAYRMDLVLAIMGARVAVFKQMEKSFADEGLFERSTIDFNIINSPRNGIAFYSQPHVLNGGTYGDAEQYCSNLSAAGYRWRLPTAEELHVLVGSDTRIIDVPDDRLWRAVVEGPPGQAILLLANTFIVNNGPEQTMEGLNPNDVNQNAWGQFLQINNDRTTSPHQNPVDIRNVRGAAATGGDPNYSVRIVCVAPITEEQAVSAKPSGPLPKPAISMQPLASYPAPQPPPPLVIHP